MEIMCSFEDVLYAGWERKDFELRYMSKRSGWDLHNFISYLDNTKLCNMDFIDQYDPNELSDDIYFDGIEILKKIEEEERAKNSDDEYIPDSLGQAILESVRGALGKK